MIGSTVIKGQVLPRLKALQSGIQKGVAPEGKSTDAFEGFLISSVKHFSGSVFSPSFAVNIYYSSIYGIW